jgi:hypothetical protein
MVVESLLRTTAFFVGLEKRPTEALYSLFKKGVVEKSLQRTAGLGSVKIKK